MLPIAGDGRTMAAMKRKSLLIDGNNLVYSDPDTRESVRDDFDMSRRKLLSKLDELAGGLGFDEVIVVFDGRTPDVRRERTSLEMEVIYAPAHKTADAVIERLVHDGAAQSRFVVVTSDRSEQHTVQAAGAEVMSCAAFIDMMEDCKRRLRINLGRYRRMSGGGRLGDCFPD